MFRCDAARLPARVYTFIALACLAACGATSPRGNGAATAQPQVHELPACDDSRAPGLVTGAHRVPPAGVFARPEKGRWYRDPMFGACAVRLTDHEREPPEGFARNDYSRRQPFNADDSLVLVNARNGYWHIYDSETLEHVRRLNLGGGSVEPHWHPHDPDILYVLPNNGGMRLMTYNVRTDERRTVADFSADIPIATHPEADHIRDLWPQAARLLTRSEGSPSMDARFWAFQVETADFKPLGMITYDLARNRILGAYDFITDGGGIGRPDHLSMSPLGRHVVVSWNGTQLDCPGRWRLGTRDRPCGLMAFSPDFRKATGLAVRGPHSDIALKRNGDEVVVISNYVSGKLEMISLEDGSVTPLWDIYDGRSSAAMHISGKAYDKPGWVLVSTYASRRGRPWYADRIMAVELTASPRIVNLASTFNAGNSYFSEPHAAVNRDFSRIIYNTNWGSGRESDVDAHLVRVPPNALQ